MSSKSRIVHEGDRCWQRASECCEKREDDFLAKAVQQTDELINKKPNIDPDAAKRSTVDVNVKGHRVNSQIFSLAAVSGYID